MNHYMLKFFKVGFWLLIPFFFISNTDSETMRFQFKEQTGIGMDADKVFEELLKGKVIFESNKGSTIQGAPFTSVSLKFMKGDQQMEFLIKEKDDPIGLRTGEYQLPSHFNGLLNNYDGVFGYADIKVLGEEPLFAKKGKLVITQIDDNNIKGYMNVVFKDNNSRELFVNGDFHAVNIKGN